MLSEVFITISEATAALLPLPVRYSSTDEGSEKQNKTADSLEAV